MPNDCIFCEIISGKSPADIVYEGDKVLAFRNIHPAAPSHVLIVPKKHIATVTELAEDDKDAAAEMLMVVDRVAEMEGIKDTGFKLVINKGGPHVEMLVNHLHMHLVGGKKLEGEL